MIQKAVIELKIRVMEVNYLRREQFVRLKNHLETMIRNHK